MKTKEELAYQIAIEIMKWKQPEILPAGKYIMVHENEEWYLGPIIGWRNEETDRFYSNKEFEEYQYWHDENGKIVNAPWGGLLNNNTYNKWRPWESNGQIWLIVNKLVEQGFHFTLHKKPGHKYVAILYKTIEVVGAAKTHTEAIFNAVLEIMKEKI